MTRPRLLDLFCKAGGATRGYQRAGFHVTGVDVEPQPNYCGDAFVQGDALEYLATRGHEYDAIHASPPCQAYTVSQNRVQSAHRRVHPDLVGQTRAALMSVGVLWAMENVPGAPMLDFATYCGASFGLGVDCWDGVRREVRRHRLFESSILLLAPECGCEKGEKIGVYGNGGSFRQRGNHAPGRKRPGYQANAEEGRAALGVPWMTRAEAAQAIPPAYTEHIGRQLLAAIEHPNDSRLLQLNCNRRDNALHF